jgi:hypothetical protein
MLGLIAQKAGPCTRLICLSLEILKNETGQHLGLIAEWQSAQLFQGYTTGLTGDDQEVLCILTPLAITRDDEVSLFGMILKDELEPLKQHEEADAAKKQSETLLYQILLRDIVAQLKAGE